MNAAETIQAAIEKLEELKSESTPGPWDFEYTDESIEVNAGSARTKWNATHDVGKPAGSWKSTDRIIEHDCYDLDDAEADQMASDAELIVTLHRTIDAQLTLFESALWLMRGDKLAYTHAAVAGTVMLAEAILGGTR